MPWWSSHRSSRSVRRKQASHDLYCRYHDAEKSRYGTRCTFSPIFSPSPLQMSNPSNIYLLTDAPPKSYLAALPPELKTMIFTQLDPVNSTCLVLTSRSMYPHHRHAHRKVGLYDVADEGLPLAWRLKGWLPEDLVLDWRSERLVSRERYAAMEAERAGRKREEEYWDGGRLRRSKRFEGRDWDRAFERQKEEEYRPRRLRRVRRFEGWERGYHGRSK